MMAVPGRTHPNLRSSEDDAEGSTVNAPSVTHGSCLGGVWVAVAGAGATPAPPDDAATSCGEGASEEDGDDEAEEEE